MDIRARIVAEYARLNVARRIDVQISAPARNAAADEFAVVLKIESEQRLRLAHLAYEPIQVFSLPRIRNKLRRRVVPHRHERENPREKRPLFNEPVEIGLACNGVGVLRCVAARNAECEPMLAKKRHGLRNLLENPLPSARIRRFLKALGRNGGHEVRDANHVLAELFIDKRGVREAQECAIGMRFAKANKVALANERLSARIDVHVRSERLSLFDDAVDIVVGQIQLVSVFGRPATRAMQVARACGIEQNSPGYIALVFVAVRFLHIPSHEVRIDQERFHESVANFRIKFADFHKKLIPVVFLLDSPSKRRALAFEEVTRRSLIDHFHRFRKALLGLFEQVIDHFVICGLFNVVYNGHGVPPSASQSYAAIFLICNLSNT